MKYDDFVKQMEEESSLLPANVLQVQESKEPKPVDTVTAVATPNSYAQFDQLSLLQQNLNNCLKIIDDEVMKGYLTTLDQLPIIEADQAVMDKLKPIHFFRITELVYQEEEFSVHKLSTLFRVLCDKPCTLVLMIKSDGETNEFFLGVRSMSADHSTATMMQMLKQSMLGLFPGSHVEDYYDEELQRDMDSMPFDCLSSVTCVADFRQKTDDLNDKRFVQGLEKFIESMHGRSYQAFFIAENIGYSQLMQIKRNYESICTQISPFANMQMNFSLSGSGSTSKGQSDGKTSGTSYSHSQGISTSDSVGTSQTEGKSEGHNTSITKGRSESSSDGRTETTGTADGVNDSESNGHTTGTSYTVGMHTGMQGAGLNASRTSNTSDTHTLSHGTSHTDSQSESISKTLTHGISSSRTSGISYGTNESHGKTQSTSHGRTDSKSYGNSESVNFVNSLTLTDTLGNTQGITLNAKNMTLNSIVNRLEKQLKRIEECESFGMWSFAAYFVGESAAETESAANVYQSVVSGTESGIECSAINTWHDEAELKQLEPYIKHFLHPNFSYQGFDYEQERHVAVTPAVLVSTSELAIHMGLPYRSVKGLPVINHASFAQEVLCKENSESNIHLGQIYHMGNMTNTHVALNLDSLASHTFVTGSTGSGKSNTVYQMLSEIRKNHATFLVIEPAKGEYHQMFPDVKCFGTNPKLGAIVRLNPFAFPPSIHVLEHIERLVEIFNVCWPMYAAMPAILKDSVERAYERSGWDLEQSENRYDPNLFPTFLDVMEQVTEVLEESAYSADNKNDYVGSLVTRLHSLTNGINGLIFSSDSLGDTELFDQNAIIDLSRVGSSETKSLLMGLLVLKLQEHRMDQRSNGTMANSSLKHVTVLEEAHNLLKRTSTEQTSEGANLLGKSVEMIANSIAEMRTYGEGFIIADQSPGLLDMAVIRNTNTKLILRLPDFSDRELVGKAAGLTDSQILELTKLEKGVAAVSQIDWLEPVLCKIDLYDATAQHFSVSLNQKITESKGTSSQSEIPQILFDCIMEKEIYRKGDRADLKRLREDVLKSRLATSIKCDFLEYLETGQTASLRKLVYGLLDGRKAVESAKKCSDIHAWVHTVADHVSLSIEQYSPEQMDLAMALLIHEQAERDAAYENILCSFTEIFKEKGGVF